jgi:hypothetical protein
MNRKLVWVGIGIIAVLLAASLALAKNKNRSVTGTWDCRAHGGSQGDMAFTLYLQQDRESIDGTISSPIGSTQVASGTFHKEMLELTFDMPQGNYTLSAKMERGKLSGTWSLDTDKGVWEATKHAVGSR